MRKSETKQKILLLLIAGVALGLSRSPKNYFKILKGVANEWDDFERQKLVRAVKEFYRDRLVEYKENSDGAIEVVLTENGKKRALKYQLDEMEIKIPQKWDGKWRVVIFDISEKRRAARGALRDKLRDLGFEELQKSVFVFPYECKDEVDFVMEVFEVRSGVVFMVTDSFTNDEKFKLKFGLY